MIIMSKNEGVAVRAPSFNFRSKRWKTEKIHYPPPRSMDENDCEKLEGAETPSPKKYLTDRQKNGEDFIAKEIFADVWEWIKKRECEQLVSPELVEHYSLSAARMVQCERAISAYGFLAKNAQGSAIVSPYVQISRDYMKQANELWEKIYQIVVKNGVTNQNGHSGIAATEHLLSFKRR